MPVGAARGHSPHTHLGLFSSLWNSCQPSHPLSELHPWPPCSDLAPELQTHIHSDLLGISPRKLQIEPVVHLYTIPLPVLSKSINGAKVHPNAQCSESPRLRLLPLPSHILPVAKHAASYLCKIPYTCLLLVISTAPPPHPIST